ncbi:MAG: insulinase family protein [Planctomycetes bacterium]|nr:insulinase family protein [Planctomycetota bacterium]
MKRRETAKAVATMLLILFVAMAAVSAADVKPITEVEGITEYRLDNGLRVLLFPDPSKPKVTVNVTVFVGSRHEGYGEAGMAHLLEHMLFKGTQKHPNIPKALKDRGAVFNGSTWYDRTNYFETLPASDENLRFALELEADRLVNSPIRAEDLASEMTVVRNEFERGENSPTMVLWQRMMAAAYLWHNYGKATIGNRADIERVPVDKLRAFYRRYYQPDNVMLVVAGQFDRNKALKHIQETFGAIPKPTRRLDKTYTIEPAQDGERLVTLRRFGDVAVVGAVYHIPAGPHPEYPSVDVLESILTSQPAGRLYKALVETKLAANVSGAAFALHDPGVLLLMAEVVPGKKPRDVLDRLIEVTEKVGRTEVTAEEVERARQRLMKQWELALTNTSRLAVQLSEWAAQGDWRLYFLYRDRLEKVTPQSVREVAAKYLRRNNRTAGLYLPVKSPERVPVPETPDLAKMIGDYKGRQRVAEGEVFDVSPENIEARTRWFRLPSGLQAAFLSKKTRGESVHLRLVIRFGDVGSLTGKAKATDFLGPLMMRGTRRLTRQQIQDLLDKHRIRLSATSSPGQISFSLQTKKPHLAAALDLLQQILREPTFPEKELDILKQAEIAGLEQQKTDPTALAQVAVSRDLNPYPKGDPRYVPTIDEEIEATRAVTAEMIRQLYRELVGGQFGQLAVVGDFDPGPTEKQLQQIFADWVAERPYQRIPRQGDVPLKRTTHVLITPDKPNATYFAATVFPLRDDDPDYPSLVLGNFILGGSTLSSRLGDRIRQREGLSYGVGSGLRTSSLDRRTLFYIFAICNPANMERVKAAVDEELQKFLADGVTADELKAAREGYLQRLKIARSDDGSLARLLVALMEAGRTMTFQAELEKRLRHVSRESILAAARRHLDPQRLVIATAGDFQPAAKPAATPKP